MSLTGTLGISIGMRPGLPAEVSFSQPRALPVERLMAGLDWKDAARRAATLFAICGRAHAIAMTLACEAAQELQPTQRATMTRLILGCAEALGEHGMRIMVDWPGLVGEQADIAILRPVRDGARKLAALAGPDAIFDGAADYANLLAEARTLAQLAEASILSRGEALAAKLIVRLDDDQRDQDYSERDTVLGRHFADPNLEGRGLVRRIRARLLEVRLICTWLAEPSLDKAPLAQHCQNCGDKTGLSFVDVARGRLKHRITLDDNRIAGLTIGAPTSENFATGGAADRAIRSISSKGREAFEWQARLAILEIDPCVAHELRIV